MKNVPIIGKFLSIIALFGVFAIGVAIYATGEMRRINTEYSGLIHHEDAATLSMARANRNFQAAKAAIGDLMQANTDAGNRAATKDLNDAKNGFQSYIDSAAKASPADASDLLQLKTQGLTVLDQDCGASLRAANIAVTPADIMAAQAGYLKDCGPKFPPITQALVAKTSEMTGHVGKMSETLSDRAGAAILITLGVILGGLTVVVAAAFFAVRNWISDPLKSLNGVMQRLAGGDLTANVAGADRKDEIGSMAKTVEVFKAAGVEKVRLEQEAIAQRGMTDADRARAEADREARAREQATVVESIATGLSRLSEGDLMFRLNSEFASDYEVLRRDFNATMDKLQQTMTVIDANTQGIRGGAGEISQAADDLSRRTEQQAASLEETAAALDQITATVRRTSEGADEASSVVGAAKTDAEHSGQVVRQAVEAMSAIESSSSQINQIIGVIDEIAFQTNLLALNAGVEAARAGDAGRGFAVVASEVRALAQRSADAAKEIKTLISASTQHVNSGVNLVGETGKALERIVGQVARINAVVIDIAASAREQATGLHEVNTAINQMDQVTQQNAAMVEQSTAASHALAREAQELTSLMAQFKIGGTQAAPRAAARSAPAATRTVMKTTGHGGAALKPAASPAEESWQDF